MHTHARVHVSMHEACVRIGACIHICVSVYACPRVFVAFISKKRFYLAYKKVIFS